jgi:hypothetical protein
MTATPSIPWKSDQFASHAVLQTAPNAANPTFAGSVMLEMLLLKTSVSSAKILTAGSALQILPRAKSAMPATESTVENAPSVELMLNPVMEGKLNA